MNARVLSKSVILELPSSKTFTCVLHDGSGIIRVVVWGADLCTAFNESLQVSIDLLVVVVVFVSLVVSRYLILILV